jgi:protein subunit release factor A
MPAARRPPPYRLDERSLVADTEIEIYTASGPGGQHRNKTQNGVRLLHRPSGVRATATERRSLEANRRAAFSRLRARLERLNQPQRLRVATAPSRGAVERRLAAKARGARTKAARSRPARDDE